MSDEAKTFMLPLAGQDVEFKRPTHGQLIMLQRIYLRATRLAEQAPDDVRLDLQGSAMVHVLDFIESLIIRQEDRDFVEAKMLAGEIDFPDLTAALSGGHKDETVADDQPPKKSIKRAASQKVSKVKPVASRARTQR